MSTIHSQNQLDEQIEFNESLRTTRAQILPTDVEQTKPLASLKADDQRQVWDKAVETANVKGIVEQLKEKLPVLA